MTQKSYFWDGASLGDAQYAPYHLSNADYESPFVDVFLRAILNGDEDRGVLKGWANELEPTCAGGTTPVQIDTGGAVVYGMPYENTAAVNVAITTPTTDVRYDRIVIRRNWTAQTARITLITGTEGGSAPAMTQSPAPDGTGIYDIPLATIETDTGGNITVTDAREYCAFSTGLGDDVFSSTHLQDDSIDWSDRATRTKRLFIGGGDLHPILNAAKFTSPGGSTTTFTGEPGWDGAADEEGWQLTGSAIEGVCGSCRIPSDYATGSVYSYVWWVANANVASTFIMSLGVQGYNPTQGYVWNGIAGASGTAIDETPAVSQVYRTAGPVCPPYTSFLFYFYAFWWNSAVGAEDVNILGVEFEYTGYT